MREFYTTNQFQVRTRGEGSKLFADVINGSSLSPRQQRPEPDESDGEPSRDLNQNEIELAIAIILADSETDKQGSD